MKKYLVLVLIVLCSFSAKALEIKDLGFKSKDIKDFKIYTRDTYENKNLLVEHDIFGIAEQDGYNLYIRAISNPGIINYETDKDLIDEVFALLNKVNTTRYSYLAHKDYKWIRFDYNSKDDNKAILEYFLSWKDIYITITFISEQDTIPNDMKNKIDDFVESIDLNGKGKVEISNIYKQGVDLFNKEEKKDHSIIVLILLCGCSIGIAWFLTRRKN